MLRRIFDLSGGLLFGLTIAASCGIDPRETSAGQDVGLVADARAASGGGEGAEGVPAWAAHRGDGACERSVGDFIDSYEYDSSGRLVREVRRSTAGATTSDVRYEYDAAGRLLRRSDVISGQVSVYSWDC